jgi:hypothetical protein
MTIKVGDHIRIGGGCSCNEKVYCWHGPKTIVLRIFWDGGLLLQNDSNYVRVARPDEVRR